MHSDGLGRLATVSEHIRLVYYILLVCSNFFYMRELKEIKYLIELCIVQNLTQPLLMFTRERSRILVSGLFLVPI